MKQQVNQQLLCVEQQCNFNREISNWNELQDHLKLSHDVLIIEKFMKEVQEIYYQQVKEQKQKYINQLNDFLQEYESSFNQQIKSLFQSIKNLCNDHLKSKLVDPQFNYTLQEMLKIYHNKLQLINVKSILDLLFSDLKKIFDEAIQNFQIYEQKCISVIYQEKIMQDTPAGLEYQQKEFQQNKTFSIQQIQNISLKQQQQQQQQWQDPFFKNNQLIQQDFNNDNFYNQQDQRNGNGYDYNQRTQQVMPLKGYRQPERINFKMPSESFRNNSRNNIDEQQQYYVPKQNNRANQKQYQNSISREKQLSPYNKQQYKNNNQQKYVEYVQKYQQFPQNNNFNILGSLNLSDNQNSKSNNILGSLNLQDNQNNKTNADIKQQNQEMSNNNLQNQQQNNESLNRMQTQDESAIRFSADSTAIIKSSNSIANIQQIQPPQEVKRKKFDIMNSDKQLKFANRFTGCFSAFEQDALVDGMFSINDDAKVGFIFSEQQGETPFPIIDMGIMEVTEEGTKIKDSKYFMENSEQKTLFVLDEQYWMEYDARQRTLYFKSKLNIGQIYIQKGQYFKFYVRVCGLNVQIL